MLFWGSLAGQGQPVKVWLESQSIDGKQVITGWCQNDTPKPERFFYRAVLRKDGTETVKEGATLALPGQPNLLLHAYFVVPEGQFEQVTLEVRDREKILASAFLLPAPTPPVMTELEPEAPTAPKSLLPSFDGIEIEGLIIDETRSKLAHDFYELFYNQWSAQDAPPGNYTITLKELPARIGIGTFLIVEVDGEQLTQLNLQPRLEVLENLAAQLAEALTEFLVNPDNNARELQAEDLTGSGIY